MDDQVNELESAILARAQRLASEYSERAQRSRDNILRDAHARLHLREEREVLLAKARAERVYRRKVQASELTLHKEMDLLRWNLVEGVRERLTEMMQSLMRDPERYQALLESLLTSGCANFEHRQLVAEVNAGDMQMLQPVWESFSTRAAPDKEIQLGTTPIDTLGGILIRSTDNRVRLDNTFEGRMERLHDQIHQVIIERLMPGSAVHEGIGAAT